MKRILPWMFFLSLLTVQAGIQTSSDTLTTQGKASFYDDSFHGRETSSGETYNSNDFTAAHRTLPFGTIVSVTNRANGKNAIVRINDRGPFVKSRIIDLTRSAARKLQMIPFGVVQVRIQVLDVLDQCPLHDSLFHPDEMMDCYGNARSSFTDHAVYIWSTTDIKHAFYMASSISIEYKLDSVYVGAIEGPAGRRYKLYASHLSSGKEASALVEKFKADGFMMAKRLPATAASKGLRPPGQSAK